jgi:hypothetical protein
MRGRPRLQLSARPLANSHEIFSHRSEETFPTPQEERCRPDQRKEKTPHCKLTAPMQQMFRGAISQMGELFLSTAGQVSNPTVSVKKLTNKQKKNSPPTRVATKQQPNSSTKSHDTSITTTATSSHKRELGRQLQGWEVEIRAAYQRGGKMIERNGRVATNRKRVRKTCICIPFAYKLKSNQSHLDERTGIPRVVSLETGS